MKLPLFLASVEHKYGTNFYIGLTAADAMGQVAAYCRKHAEMEGVKLNPAMNDGDVISAYFDEVNDEFCNSASEANSVEVPQLFVTIEGGAIQGAFSTGPLVGSHITVIDYDVEEYDGVIHTVGGNEAHLRDIEIAAFTAEIAERKRDDAAAEEN